MIAQSLRGGEAERVVQKWGGGGGGGGGGCRGTHEKSNGTKPRSGAPKSTTKKCEPKPGNVNPKKPKP